MITVAKLKMKEKKTHQSEAAAIKCERNADTHHIWALGVLSAFDGVVGSNTEEVSPLIQVKCLQGTKKEAASCLQLNLKNSSMFL